MLSILLYHTLEKVLFEHWQKAISFYMLTLPICDVVNFFAEIYKADLSIYQVDS